MVIDVSLFAIPGIVLMLISLFLLGMHDQEKKLLNDKWGKWSVICFLLGMAACMFFVYLIGWLFSD